MNMTINERRHIVFSVLNSLFESDYIDIGKLMKDLPKQTLEMVDQQTKIEMICECLGLDNLLKLTHTKRPKKSDFKWL